MTTFHEFAPASQPVNGTEIVPYDYPFGAGIYQTQQRPFSDFAAFAVSSLTGTANTWTLGQIWSATSTFSVAPIFTNLTGYVKANGAGVAATASAAIPMSAITGTLPGAQLPTPTSTVLGGVKSSAAGASQFATGINTSGAITYAQPAFTDISGTLTFASLGGTIATGQIANSTVTLAQMANLTANRVIGNNTGSPATPTALSPSSVLDIIGATQGQILYRDASAWLPLAPGSSGNLLKSNGAGANPSWAGTTGTWTLLSTIATTSGTSVTATSLAAYDTYYVTINNVVTASNDTLRFYVSINNGGLYTNLAIVLGVGGVTAHYGIVDIRGATTDIIEFTGGGANTAGPNAFSTTAGNFYLIGGQINAMKIDTTAAVAFTSGTIKIYGR